MDTNPNTGKTKRRVRKVTEEKPQKITIEVSRYKSLMDALDNDAKMWRIVLTVFLCGVLLFAGITVVVVSIKSFYPYSDISTNALGVTTLKNEKKEISYWLFNTSELWAKSGIKVKKGQTITVRASGKKHTAIHHLYDDAKDNASQLTDRWEGTKGFAQHEHPRSERDKYRAKYRIFPEENQDALLMQIVKNGNKVASRKEIASYAKQGKFFPVFSENRFLFIGEEQENIYIEEDGELYFAVNDIVTDDLSICRMMYEMSSNKKRNVIECMQKSDSLRREFRKNHTLRKGFREFSGDYSYYDCNDSLKRAEIYKSFKNIFSYNDTLNKETFDFGNDKYGALELFGYFMDKYETPWYDDNIGSFLIVVETSLE